LWNLFRDAKGPEDFELGIFIAEEVDGIGDMESGDTTRVSVGTFIGAFFVGLQTWECFPQLPE
jgi:hypothetical protein